MKKQQLEIGKAEKQAWGIEKKIDERLERQSGTKEKWEGGVVVMAHCWMKWKMEINKRWIEMEGRCP